METIERFNAEDEIEKIIKGMKAYNSYSENPKAIVNISGGKDSTVVAALAVKAFGKENVLGILIPNGEQADIADSHKVCSLLEIRNITVNIGESYNELTNAIENGFAGSGFTLPFLKNTKSYYSNTPARLRMVVAYGVSHCVGGLVLNTCNRSEDIMGYSTLYGDSAGGYGPIVDYTVSEVRQIGLALGLPAELIMKAPSDGMCGSTDEQNLGEQLNIKNFTYERLDNFIRGKKECDFTNEEKESLIKRYKQMKYKLDIINMPHPDAGLYDYFKEEIVD